ncbi:hypothetical protein CMV_030561 [Castanea mollissima]|uniref:Secreted protein n=1 Tax=Castanea mollissima TaxID=60419 RepID=A0A8J4Q508_9ROSI|nr:hypothetical protein CMV_030561 [Castanea mollissima]
MIDFRRMNSCCHSIVSLCAGSLHLSLLFASVLEENLDWEDVQWSQTGVWIAGKEYTLARVHFLSMN